MSTQCTPLQLEFPRAGRRRVVARFDGGTLTSNAGALLLRAVEACTGVSRRAAACFEDARDARRVEHPVQALLTQRVLALALGYPDLNDHDTLRRDPLLAAVVGKTDPTGATRARAADRGAALAGKSTLNRMELSPPAGTGSRYKKVHYAPAALDALRNRRTSFNEAAGCPRGSRRRAGCHAGYRIASMRPRVVPAEVLCRRRRGLWHSIASMRPRVVPAEVGVYPG